MIDNRRIVLAVAAYSAANVCLLLAFAKSLLGPVPFDLIYLLIFASFGGTFAVPVLFGRRIGWQCALVCSLLLFAVLVFNVWCLFSASAAV